MTDLTAETDEKLYTIALEKRKNGNGTTRKDYDE
jgi:hypothetical protein